jgi:hypothetical protein
MIRLHKIRHRQPNQKPCLQSFVDHVQAAVSGQYLGFDNLVSIRHVTNREQSVHIDSGCAVVARCVRIHNCRIRELKLATIVIEKARIDKNNNSSGSSTQRKRCKQ